MEEKDLAKEDGKEEWRRRRKQDGGVKVPERKEDGAKKEAMEAMEGVEGNGA